MHCLVLGKVWPEPNSTAAGQRTRDLLAVLAEAGWQLSFASPAQRGDHSLDLAQFGATAHPIQVNDPNFDSWVARLRPDVVVFDRFMTEEQFGWRVATECPDTLRVLDTSDLHCLRVAREAQLKFGGAVELRNETALREVASIYRSDLTLVISEFEMNLLRDEFLVPDRLLAHWPFFVNLRESVPSYEEREHFIMIGSLMHAPNLDAARWCQQVIWPKIRKVLPGAELHVYGSYGDRYAKELDRPGNGFYFKGRAREALSTMARYRVNLAPLRFGAGLKGKIFDGFRSGTPAVMTPIAAEGIFMDAGWSCESDEEFVKEATELYRSPELWRARRDAERTVCRECFAPARWRPRLREILSEACLNRSAYREANFIGQMLRHHHHRSTEFLSRWIEAKNKNNLP